MTSIDIDIDAALGELKDKTLKLYGEVFNLPAELPGACLAPFLAKDLKLGQIIADIFADDDKAEKAEKAGETVEEKSWLDTILDQLATSPDLPHDLLEAARVSFNTLFDHEAGGADRLHALKPSVPAYLAIVSGVVRTYGVGLADFFFSSESSEDGGDDSKQTSPGTTPASTPEASGEPQPQAA